MSSSLRWPDERVLVVPRRLFDELGSFQGLTTDVERYLPAFLDPANNYFLGRDAAEEDPGHKQIIPYALFHHAGRFLHYVRGGKSNEQRLAAKGSLGIGGHINADDAAQSSVEQDTYLTGVAREMNEELRLRSSYRQRIVALINDDSNEVGQVHIGVVHLFDLDGDDVAANEAPITELSFLSREELAERRSSLETWSQICFDHLNQILP
jgi:predicted NUDIX family phosphoesterase